MAFIRKYASPLALLAVLSALVAAPYLIPENPDSAVFRSSSLGLILVLACFYPVSQTLSRVNRRQLICGLVFGLLFAVALSIGSELFIYNGLLRGTGSLIRRISIPFLAAPVLGVLAARLMLIPCPSRPAKGLCIPLWGYALFFLLCWLPVLLAFYPAALNYDFPGQYNQHLAQSYSNLHPLLHSVLSNGIIALFDSLGHITLGVLVYTLIQMIVFSFSLAYSCVFVQKRGAPAWVLVLMSAAYAFLPIFSVMSISTCKDTLFSSCLLVLSLKTYAFLEAPDAFMQKKVNILVYALCGMGTALLRNNGLFAFILLIPSLLIASAGSKKHAALLLASSLVLAGGSTLLLNLIFQPESPPSFQLYSLPAQQLVRAYNNGQISEADRAEIREWYVSEYGLIVHPHLGDGAKGYLDKPRIQKEGALFLNLWAKNARANAHEYLEAFLLLNIGSWYPDDLSHASIYRDASYNDKGYLQLSEYDMDDIGIKSRSYLPKLRDLFERICRRNSYQKYPIISLLFSTATPFWMLLLACTRLISVHRTRMLPSVLGVLAIWLSYLFGPCTLARYMLPLFCLAPAMLTLAFCTSAHLSSPQ